MNVITYNQHAEAAGAPQQYKAAVVCVHGMNTDAQWLANMAADFSDKLIRFRPVSYGWIISDVVKKAQREAVARMIVREYEEQMAFADRPSAIAHSFGTLCLSHALDVNPALRLGKAILVNSIMPVNYDWPRIFAANQVQGVRVEVCPIDKWPKLAKYVIPGSGPSGTKGFSATTPQLEEVVHPKVGHSDLLTRLHCRTFWIPFLLS